MSRLISDILGAPEPHFRHAIHSWEKSSNNKGHDNRLISDIVAGRKKAIQELRLDVNDTTAEELYYALLHKASQTNHLLELNLGINQGDPPEVVLNKIMKLVDQMDYPNEVWSIKQSVLKQMLKTNVPKKLLKSLGLRSIDSVLKNFSCYQLLALASEVESSEWLHKNHQQYKKLKPNDFQSSKVIIESISSDKITKIRRSGYKKASIVIPNHETGTIMLIPPIRRFKNDTLAILYSLLQSLHELRVYSAYFKHTSVKKNFGQLLFEIMNNGLPGQVADTTISWRSLQKHFNNFPDSFDKFEQPYFQREDIYLVAPESILVEVIPDIAFWENKSYLFAYENKNIVSLHLMDVLLNASNNIPFEKATSDNLKQKLWEELGCRYLESPPIEMQLIKIYS